MLLRIDRLILRVPNLQSATRFYTQTFGLKLLKQDNRVASLRFAEDEAELILHTDPDLPAEAIYYRVNDVRDLYARREALKLQFLHPPTAVARGYRAVIKDPFGNVLMIVDRSTQGSGETTVVEDGKPPSALFPGMEEKVPVKRDELIRAYEKINRTADDLPYTPEFEKLFAVYSLAHQGVKPTRDEAWRHLLNLRKGGKLPKLGEARSKPPEISPEAKAHLVSLVAEDLGKRDRLPYTDRFDVIVDAFNKTQARALSPHLVWRLVATLAK